MSTTIRVNQKTRDRFAELSKATGRPMAELLEEAADALERRLFFDQIAERYSELRRDRRASAEIEAERDSEDAPSPMDRGERVIARLGRANDGALFAIVRALRLDSSSDLR